MLQRMEKEGHVVRTRGISDGRQTLVSLSRRGRALEEQAKDVPACLTQHWHDDFSNLEQLTQLANTLDTLINTLKK